MPPSTYRDPWGARCAERVLAPNNMSIEDGDGGDLLLPSSTPSGGAVLRVGQWCCGDGRLNHDRSQNQEMRWI